MDNYQQEYYKRRLAECREKQKHAKNIGEDTEAKKHEEAASDYQNMLERVKPTS